MNTDINKTNASVDCPTCNKTSQATLAQLINGDTILCEHCKKEIRLKEHNEDSEKSERKLKNAFAKLEKKLKKE
jgi:hydrogenase maturation factor HypF (carbamoyltransferase family)